LDLFKQSFRRTRKLALKTGEYETLEQEYDRLANFEALMHDSQHALSLLNEGDSPMSQTATTSLTQLRSPCFSF
jgi:DNA repair protein RecN (Recombination protein N)